MVYDTTANQNVTFEFVPQNKNMDYIKKLLHNCLTACLLPHSHDTVWLTYGRKTTAVKGAVPNKATKSFLH